MLHYECLFIPDKRQARDRLGKFVVSIVENEHPKNMPLASGVVSYIVVIAIILAILILIMVWSLNRTGLTGKRGTTDGAAVAIAVDPKVSGISACTGPTLEDYPVFRTRCQILTSKSF